MRKLLLPIMLLLVCASIANADIYTYYDDFSAQNTTVWDTSSVDWAIQSNRLDCLAGTSGSNSAILANLTGTGINFTTQDFIIEIRLNQTAASGVFDMWISNDTAHIVAADWGYGEAVDDGTNSLYEVSAQGAYGYIQTALGFEVAPPVVLRFEGRHLANGSVQIDFNYTLDNLNNTFNHTYITPHNWNLYNMPTLGFRCKKNVADRYGIDWLNISAGDVFPAAPNTAPNVTVTQPANNTETNTQTDVQVTPVDDNASTMSCELYIDGTLNQTNASAVNNTLTTFSMTWAEGSHTWYVNCSDGEYDGTTGTLYYYLDTQDPDINSVLPNIFNTTQYTNYTMRFLGNVTNVNLTEVNRTVLYPNGTVYMSNVTTVFADPTIISWDETYNTTLEPNGNYTQVIYANDTVNNNLIRYYTFEVANCVPSWSCSGYATCNISDLAPCNNASDSNSCGIAFGTFGEQYSDFSAQACNYCQATEILLNSTSCLGGTQTLCYSVTNFATCCNVTQAFGNIDDCPYGNNSINCSATSCSAYVGRYDTSDLSEIAIDFWGAFGVYFVSFSMLAAMGYLFIVLVRTIRKYKN